MDLLVVSDAVGEVAVQQHRPARERTYLRCCGRAQGWVERPARSREHERVEVVEEPWRCHLGVRDQGGDDPRRLVELLVAGVVAEHGHVCHVRREDGGVVVTGIAGEHRRCRSAGDEGGELDVFVRCAAG